MPAALLLLTALLSAKPVADIQVAPADVAVVCPESFHAALQPWIELRRQQGHTIAMLSNLGTPDNIRERIRAVARGGKLRFVVLVGDATYGMTRDPAIRMTSVPMHYAKAKVNVKWGSLPQISTDNWYAQDPSDVSVSDDTPMPELAVGRITANSAAELGQIVAKIIAYEQTTDFGPWRQRINLVAGPGNFGILADTLIESTARQILTANIPAEYHVSMTYANWQSPYCPAPQRFHQTTLDRLNEGSLFWVYIGHASPSDVAPLVAMQKYAILAAKDSAKLTCHKGQPIAIFLCCYAGAIDAKGRCLASELLAAPGGPVAVIAASRVTMPYAEAVLSNELGNAFFRHHSATIGEALLDAKQAMLREPKKDDAQRKMLDALAAVVDPAAKQMATERAEHVLMYNLVGDPLLRLRFPQEIPLSAPHTIKAGDVVTFHGTSPMSGHGRIELVTRRDRLPGERPARKSVPVDAAGGDLFDQQYFQANDHSLSASDVDITQGPFSADFTVPRSATGACHVCLTVSRSSDFAAGSCDVDVVQGR